MKQFTDNAERTWTVEVNVAAIKRVKSLLDVNLLEALEGDLLDELAHDMVLLCDVIYALCKPEADAIGITDEQFGQAMAGDAIDFATTALLEELVEFFPLAKRRVLTKALAKMRNVDEKAIAYAEAKLDDPELDRKIDDALTALSDSATSSPDDSGSPPTD